GARGGVVGGRGAPPAPRPRAAPAPPRRGGARPPPPPDPDGLLPRYREGLLAGTDPDHPDAWPPIVDRGQSLVEAASLAIALDLTRQWLWDALDPAEQERVARWLAPSARVATPDNNWVLFRVVVQEFLAGSGFAHEASVIESGLERIETWYDGDGWYRDGDGQNFDYYNAWAMHLYPLLWARMHERRDPARAAAFRERATARLADFLPQHVRFFGADGTPVFQGRSLPYRFAALAPLWLGELHGVSPLEPGALRRLASLTFRRFGDGGAFDERGLLTNGWLGAFPPMVQVYSGPASPYWASKGFLGLLLPEDSPVWSAPEVAAPVERSDASLRLAAPGYLLSTTAGDGIVRLVNHGSDHHPPLAGPDDPHYGRLSYSSATAPSYDPHPVDAHVALIDARGRASRRGAIERIETLEPGVLASAHEPYWAEPDAAFGDVETVWSGVRVSTASLVHGACSVHLVLAESAPDLELPLRIGGHALAGGVAPGSSTEARPTGLAASRIEDGRLVSVVHDLLGGLAAGVHRTSGTSPYGAEVAVPLLDGRHVGPYSVHLVAFELRGAFAEAPEEAAPLPALVALEASGDRISAELEFGDGTRRSLSLPLDLHLPLGADRS
ncbi:DUF2264 domain-containing protein, partial [Agromyces soli]